MNLILLRQIAKLDKLLADSALYERDAAGAQAASIERGQLVKRLAEAEEATAHRLNNAYANLQKLGGRAQPSYRDIEKLIRARAMKGGIDTESARLLVNRNLVKDGNGMKWRSDPRLILTSPVRMTEKQILNMLTSVHASTILIEAVPPIGVFDEETLVRGLPIEIKTDTLVYNEDKIFIRRCGVEFRDLTDGQRQMLQQFMMEC